MPAAKPDLAAWINPSLLRDPEKRAAQYRVAKPYPYAAISNFLRPDKAKSLARHLRMQPLERKESDLFSFWQTKDLRDSEDPVIKEFLAVMASKEVRAWFTAITRVPIRSLDAMGAIYRDTDHLLCHDDELEGRRIAYILNLSVGFTAKEGGALALLDCDEDGRPRRVVKRITPSFNTLAFFTVSRCSHHAVEEITGRKERRTIGGWFHG